MIKKFMAGFISIVMILSAVVACADDGDTDETSEIVYNTTIAPDLNAKAVELASPVKIYEYLLNNAEYALYHGSRSSSVNSFLALRGNDVDLASTLIAMYRSRGYHARYAVGTVRLPVDRAMNWLGVKNADLAASIMKDQGIQNVTLSADKNTIDFEHTWVEAYVPYGKYRGSGSDASVTSCTASSNCRWVALDPSFKQKQYNDQGIDPYSTLQFDYTSYYNAIKNSDASRMNKSPLEIYEEQILAWLQTNHPGKTLEDVAYAGDIVVQDNLILPASLPFTVTGTPRRYNSIAAHDAAVPATEPKKWAKNLTITVYPPGNIIGSVGIQSIQLSDLTTKRLTLTTELNGDAVPELVVRLDGNEIARPFTNLTQAGYTPAIGNPFSFSISMDGVPAAASGGTDQTISATYSAIVGGYYLLATGGETSNWSQVHRAAQQLLTANQQYKIVFNSSESGCDISTGINCTPYVDANGNGWDSSDTKLLDNKTVLDDLTGGLLYVAAMQYYAKLRDSMARIDAINHVKTPISGYLGVVSSTHEIEYIDGTAFSVLPGGLLIDMKGINVSGAWRIDQPAQYSNSNFELVGHTVSSLEHEIWQELTGYDAISTVRGIQMALANDATLLDLKKNTTTDTVQTMYSAMGYSSSPPSGFTLDRRSIYSTLMDSWAYATTDGSQSFVMIEKQPSGASDSRRNRFYYYNDYFDGNLGCFYSIQNQLQTLQNSYGGSYPLNAGKLCISSFPVRTTVAQAIALNQSDYATYRTSYVGAAAFDYMDENKGFNSSSFVYRGVNGLSDSAQPSTSVTAWRDILYLRDLTKGWNEIIMPSRLSTGSNFRFSVDIWKTFDTNNNVTSALFEIQNMAGISAGGGYVPANGVLLQQATSIFLSGSSNTVPTFNNAVFTDKNTISQVNNDAVKTPSTADPVSTVTGNNYHDETDFAIKGRGLNIALTRTYNSAPSSTKTDGPFGYGWSHSYGMKLTSNDYGICPNCTTAQKPENGNGKTSSITYTDERGGEHNYLVNESTYAVTPPTGEFDTLSLDTPSSGYYTLTFRNGVKYVFQGSNLKTTPGNTAKLTQILDSYGNQLAFGYDGNGNLNSITDNLAISGRTGLAITCYPGTMHIKDITDWSGRKWSYTYDTYGNLQSVTNPVSKTTQYTYSPTGSHSLTLVTLPENRGGTPVATTFVYYQNGKTFNYKNSLGQAETMDYDLYRRSTRVTDPRGFVREYEYDANGLMTKLTEPDGGIALFDNTTDLLRYKKTDALNYVTTYSYRNDHSASGASDTGGNVTQETDPLSNTLQYSYGIYDQVTTIKDKNGNTFTTTYYTSTNPSTGAVAGKPQSITLGSLSGTANVLLKTYTYNPDGTIKQMVEQIDPAVPSRRRITDFVWENNQGLNLQKVTVSGSGKTVQTTYAYDSLGRKRSETLWRRASPTDATLTGLSTSYTYDAHDRVTRVTDPVGNIMENIYDGNGKVQQVNGYYVKSDGTYDARVISVRTYDAADRLGTETDIYGNVTRYVYDEAGNLIRVTDPNGHIVKYEYDAMNRRTAVIDANGFKARTIYDAAGHPVQVINPLDKATVTSYDAIGRPTAVTDPLAHQTTFTYDANGNLKTMVDANANAGLQPKNSYGATVYKEYDELNRVKREVDALGGVTSYTYDLLGNITSIADAEKHTTTFIYDDLGRLAEVRDPLYATTNKATTFTYYETGNVLTKTKRNGAVATYTYDLLNRPTQALFSSAGGSIVETTVYDIYGNKLSVSNQDVTYTYEYDLKNRPTKKTDSRVNKSLVYTYGKAGEVLSKTSYDGSVTEYRYDSANKLVAERNADYLQVSYQYDGAGRLLNRILSNGAKTSYSWDDGNRLASLTNTGANGTVVNSTAYQRDRVGNITSQADASGTTAFTYDALYRLTNADYPGTGNDVSYTYDKVGNRLTETRSSFASVQGTQSFTYDAKGRVTSVNDSMFKYDPYDYRISKNDSKGSQTYLLEGEHLEAIMSGNNWSAIYMRGAVIDEVVNGFQYSTDGVWTNYTFHHDTLQSVLGLSGHDGSVLQTVNYGPFGEKITAAGATNNNPLHFTGREEDADSGLYYFRARYYDPAIGRFITEDPMGFAAGINFYAYANNNPINANDPTGNWAWIDDAIFTFGGGAIGVINQGFSNFIFGKGLMPENYARDYWAAFVGGAVSGETLLYAAPLGPAGAYAAGAAGGVASNVFKQSWSLATTSSYKWDFVSTVTETLIGTLTGRISMVKLPVLSVGRNSLSAIFKQMTTKFSNGTISNISARTAMKMFAGANVDSFSNGFFANLFNEVFDRLKGGEIISSEATYSADITAIEADGVRYDLSDLGSAQPSASGGFVIYPNKANTNMMRSVYAK